MNLRKIDLFSQSFEFYVGEQQVRKGTSAGAILTIAILSATLVYFVYLSDQYFTNQIDPKFRAQSIITEDTTEVSLRNDLIGFRFEYDVNTSIDSLQQQQNLTYLVHYAYFLYQNQSNLKQIPINITQCTNEELIGYNCLDFSSISNYTLMLNTKQNILSQILIYTYGCYDIDSVKSTIPNNCANQTDIDNMINGEQAQFRLKLFTQQYNTTSQQVQVNYRNFYIILLSDQFALTTLKAQQQVTKVKSGFLIQSENKFSSPIQYSYSNQGFDRIFSLSKTFFDPYIQITLVMDEIVQQFQIQYPTFPEILSIVNGMFAILMTLGIIGRGLSKKYIKEDMYLLFLQNMYHDTYERLIQSNTIFEQKERFCLDNQSKRYNENVEEYKDILDSPNLILPSISTKLKQLVDISSNMKEPQDQTQKDILERQYQENQICQTQSNKPDSFFGQINTHIESEQNKSNIDYQSIKIDYADWLEKPHFITEQESQQQSQRQFQEDGKQKQQTEKNKLFISKFSLISKDQENNQKNNISAPQLLPKKSAHKISNLMKKSNKLDTSNISKEIVTKKRVLSVSVQKSQYKSSITPNNNVKIKKSEYQDIKEINEHFSQKLKNLQDQNISEIIKNKIFSLNIFNKKYNLDLSVKKLIDSQVNKSLDILQVYKEIIFIKKVMMILLTKDQLAAISLVGCSPYFLNQELNEIENKKYSEYNEEKQNYFEQQLAISLSQELQQKYIKKFLSKCSNNNSVSEIDYRILSSILRSKIK